MQVIVCTEYKVLFTQVHENMVTCAGGILRMYEYHFISGFSPWVVQTRNKMYNIPKILNMHDIVHTGVHRMYSVS